MTAVMSDFQLQRDMLRILREARELIGKREHWTKGARHRPAIHKGEYITAHCAIGAIEKAAVSLGYAPNSEQMGAAASLVRAEMGSGIPSYNDLGSTTHQMVLGKFDAAIAKIS